MNGEGEVKIINGHSEGKKLISWELSGFVSLDRAKRLAR